jgi:hypothetical protein
MDHYVIDHHFDKAIHAYRLTVGLAIEHTVPMVDEEGNALMEEVPLLDDAGEPVTDEDGNPYTAQKPMLEVRRELVPTEDFLFHADDKRWEGKTVEEVAAAQRRLVKRALRERENAASEEQQRREAAITSLPGAGEGL